MRRSLKLLCGSILLLVLNFLNLVKTHHHQSSSSAYYKGGGGVVAIIIFEVSWQVLKIAFRSLQIWNFFRGDTLRPPPPLQGFCFRHSRYGPPPPPVTKNLATAVTELLLANSAQLTNSEPIKPTESGKKGLDCYCLYHVRLSFWWLS